ncbi:MAG: ATP-binding protein, partial [Thermoflexus sp.]
KRLGPSFLGRTLDLAFLADLPADVDPAGENGEFHTFVFDGPGFHQPVAFALGEVVFRDGFWFQDLIPL